jgi:hypothetical protein
MWGRNPTTNSEIFRVNKVPFFRNLGVTPTAHDPDHGGATSGAGS